MPPQDDNMYSSPNENPNRADRWKGQSLADYREKVYNRISTILMNQNETPLEIVCGNSQPMISLVDSVLKRINCENYEMVQYGVLMVRKV